MVKFPGMVSQVIDGSCYEWTSYVKGYRKYKSVWSPTVKEILQITMELTNSHDPFAMPVLKDDYKVGHIPRAAGRMVSLFLRKDDSVGFCEVIGVMVNRGAGFGLEISCAFHGSLACIERVKNLLL